MRTYKSFLSQRIIFLFATGIFLLTMMLTLTASERNILTGDLLSPAVPFPGPEPKSLPTTLEAENFDRGGEGVGYHELSGTAGSGIYRNHPVEGVDIQASPGASAGFVVTETSAGEWLSYTIFAAAAGSYELGARYITEFRGGTFHFEVDGQNVTGAVSVAPTSANFRSFFKRIDLTAGRHTLRLVMDGNSKDPATGADAATVCDFDSISLRLVKALADDPAKGSGSLFNFMTDEGSPSASASLISPLPHFTSRGDN